MDSLPHDLQRSGLLIASLNSRAIQTAQELDRIISQLLQDQDRDSIDSSTGTSNEIGSYFSHHTEFDDSDDSVHDQLPKLLSLYSDLRFLRSNSYAESIRMNSAIENSQINIASEIYRIQTYLKSDAAKDLLRRVERLHSDDTSEIVKDLERLKIYTESPLQASRNLNEDGLLSEEEDGSDQERDQLIDERFHNLESSDEEDFSEFFKFLDDEKSDTEEKEEKEEKKDEEKEEGKSRSEEAEEKNKVKSFVKEALSNDEKNTTKEICDCTRNFQLLNLPRGRRRTRTSQAAATESEVDVKFIESEENQGFLKRQVTVIEKLLNLGIVTEPDQLLPRLMEKGNITAEDALAQLEKIKAIEDLFFLGLIGFVNEKPPALLSSPTKNHKARSKTDKVAKAKATDATKREPSKTLPEESSNQKPLPKHTEESSHELSDEQINQNIDSNSSNQQSQDKIDELSEVLDQLKEHSPTSTTSNIDSLKFFQPLIQSPNSHAAPSINETEDLESQPQQSFEASQFDQQLGKSLNVVASYLPKEPNDTNTLGSEKLSDFDNYNDQFKYSEDLHNSPHQIKVTETNSVYSPKPASDFNIESSDFYHFDKQEPSLIPKSPATNHQEPDLLSSNSYSLHITESEVTAANYAVSTSKNSEPDHPSRLLDRPMGIVNSPVISESLQNTSYTTQFSLFPTIDDKDPPSQSLLSSTTPFVESRSFEDVIDPMLETEGAGFVDNDDESSKQVAQQPRKEDLIQPEITGDKNFPSSQNNNDMGLLQTSFPEDLHENHLERYTEAYNPVKSPFLDHSSDSEDANYEPSLINLESSAGLHQTNILIADKISDENSHKKSTEPDEVELSTTIFKKNNPVQSIEPSVCHEKAITEVDNISNAINFDYSLKTPTQNTITNSLDITDSEKVDFKKNVGLLETENTTKISASLQNFEDEHTSKTLELSQSMDNQNGQSLRPVSKKASEPITDFPIKTLQELKIADIKSDANLETEIINTKDSTDSGSVDKITDTGTETELLSVDKITDIGTETELLSVGKSIVIGDSKSTKKSSSEPKPLTSAEKLNENFISVTETSEISTLEKVSDKAKDSGVSMETNTAKAILSPKNFTLKKSTPRRKSISKYPLSASSDSELSELSDISYSLEFNSPARASQVKVAESVFTEYLDSTANNMGSSVPTNANSSLSNGPSITKEPSKKDSSSPDNSLVALDKQSDEAAQTSVSIIQSPTSNKHLFSGNFEEIDKKNVTQQSQPLQPAEKNQDIGVTSVSQVSAIKDQKENLQNNYSKVPSSDSDAVGDPKSQDPITQISPDFQQTSIASVLESQAELDTSNTDFFGELKDSNLIIKSPNDMSSVTLIQPDSDSIKSPKVQHEFSSALDNNFILAKELASPSNSLLNQKSLLKDFNVSISSDLNHESQISASLLSGQTLNEPTEKDKNVVDDSNRILQKATSDFNKISVNLHNEQKAIKPIVEDAESDEDHKKNTQSDSKLAASMTSLSAAEPFTFETKSQTEQPEPVDTKNIEPEKEEGKSPQLTTSPHTNDGKNTANKKLILKMNLSKLGSNEKHAFPSKTEVMNSQNTENSENSEILGKENLILKEHEDSDHKSSEVSESSKNKPLDRKRKAQETQQNSTSPKKGRQSNQTKKVESEPSEQLLTEKNALLAPTSQGSENDAKKQEESPSTNRGGRGGGRGGQGNRKGRGGRNSKKGRGRHPKVIPEDFPDQQASNSTDVSQKNSEMKDQESSLNLNLEVDSDLMQSSTPSTLPHIHSDEPLSASVLEQPLEMKKVPEVINTVSQPKSQSVLNTDTSSASSDTQISIPISTFTTDSTTTTLEAVSSAISAISAKIESNNTINNVIVDDTTAADLGTSTIPAVSTEYQSVESAVNTLPIDDLKTEKSAESVQLNIEKTHNLLKPPTTIAQTVQKDEKETPVKPKSGRRRRHRSKASQSLNKTEENNIVEKELSNKMEPSDTVEKELPNKMEVNKTIEKELPKADTSEFKTELKLDANSDSIPSKSNDKHVPKIEADSMNLSSKTELKVNTTSDTMTDSAEYKSESNKKSEELSENKVSAPQAKLDRKRKRKGSEEVDTGVNPTPKKQTTRISRSAAKNKEKSSLDPPQEQLQTSVLSATSELSKPDSKLTTESSSETTKTVKPPADLNATTDNKTSKPAIKPSVESPKISTATSTTKSTAKPAAKPTAKPTAKSTTKTPAKPTAKSAKVSEPTTKPKASSKRKKLYCVCQRDDSICAMVQCDNKKNCKYEWMHVDCLDPSDRNFKGHWYCIACRKSPTEPNILKTELQKEQKSTEMQNSKPPASEGLPKKPTTSRSKRKKTK